MSTPPCTSTESVLAELTAPAPSRESLSGSQMLCVVHLLEERWSAKQSLEVQEQPSCVKSILAKENVQSGGVIELGTGVAGQEVQHGYDWPEADCLLTSRQQIMWSSRAAQHVALSVRGASQPKINSILCVLIVQPNRCLNILFGVLVEPLLLLRVSTKLANQRNAHGL